MKIFLLPRHPAIGYKDDTMPQMIDLSSGFSKYFTDGDLHELNQRTIGNVVWANAMSDSMQYKSNTISDLNRSKWEKICVGDIVILGCRTLYAYAQVCGTSENEVLGRILWPELKYGHLPFKYFIFYSSVSAFDPPKDIMDVNRAIGSQSKMKCIQRTMIINNPQVVDRILKELKIT